ncbi:MAG: helix-turn-helix domain-containing protein [Bryobacteraceae bacterium]|jgi:hypothetical protein
MSSSLVQPLLDSNRVARLLGIEVETLGAWRRKGYGPRWYRIGKNVRYTETDLRVWMNAQAQRSLSPAVGSLDDGRATDVEPLHQGQSPMSDWRHRR